VVRGGFRLGVRRITSGKGGRRGINSLRLKDETKMFWYNAVPPNPNTTRRLIQTKTGGGKEWCSAHRAHTGRKHNPEVQFDERRSQLEQHTLARLETHSPHKKRAGKNGRA